ncbi:MAG TPA: DUF1987 domain-containing protein [Salinivirgaceae bacterium]|nr:DUF1987 domain-containing protein [Salinivirgaceae bacterium]HQA76029.1 DUF1987 domain-containing protein [Salinivirgaceae bacterium]
MTTKNLIIEATRQTPGIYFDSNEGIFHIFGQSYPEDVNEVFKPIFEWLSDFEPERGKQYIVKINMKYYNSASSRKLFDLLRTFNELYRNNYLFTVQWCYNKEDEDILESGQNFDDLTEMPFEFIVNLQ